MIKLTAQQIFDKLLDEEKSYRSMVKLDFS